MANTEEKKKEPLFPLGAVVLTRGAARLLSQYNLYPSVFLKRHERGDYGELSENDVRLNRAAVRSGLRIISNYPVGRRREMLWVITEADRSVTTLLLPEEY